MPVIQPRNIAHCRKAKAKQRKGNDRQAGRQAEENVSVFVYTSSTLGMVWQLVRKQLSREDAQSCVVGAWQDPA